MGKVELYLFFFVSEQMSGQLENYLFGVNVICEITFSVTQRAMCMHLVHGKLLIGK